MRFSKAILASLAASLTVVTAQSADLVSAFTMVNQARAEKLVKPLSWNADLAAYAKLWANLIASGKVPFEHATGDYRPQQGEVLYVQEASGCHPTYDAPYQSGMHAWLAQAPLYNDQPIMTGHEPWLHWSQCMWSESTEIGCARAYSISDAYKIYVVCRFSPEGNVVGQKPF